MKGTVISYGQQGDPVVRPEDGSKLTVLTQYSTKPSIGETIDYRVTIQGKRVNRGVLQAPNGNLADNKHPLQEQLTEIQSLWDGSFAQHMTPESIVHSRFSSKSSKDKRGL